MDRALDIIRDQLVDKQKQLLTALGSGSAKDYAEYRAMCGEIRGLTLAEGYILDLANQMEYDDE
jgi:hypothetical protein